MKTKKRILSILLTLCMLVGAVGVLPVSAIEYSSEYAISNVTYVPTGTLGSTQDMLQWSDVGAISYRLEIYDENDIVIDYVIQTENYVPAVQILPYSGKFYVVVVPLDENNVSVWSGTASDMFTYTDTTAPTVAWLEDGTVRSNDSEATVQFDNLDRYSACTYYYAIVDSGEAAPTIDTSGTGIAANDSSDNYINLTDLTVGAKDIYLILKDQDGNASEPIMTTIPAYVPTVKYWVSVTASPFDGSGGTVSGEGEYAPGEQVTISIAPNTDSGYCAAQWGLSDIGGGVISAINQKTSHTFTMPENAVQISITFTQHSYITYSDLENGTHQNKCFYCMTPNGDPEAHVDAHGGGDGTTPPDGYCDLCSAELHTHSYSSEWSSDEEGHWHYCECGMTSDFAEHTSSGAATEDAAEVCTVCGYEISPKLSHTHSYGTLKYDSNNHWYECSCGDKSDVTAHSGGTATCTEKAVCSVCNQSYGNLKNHSYSSSWSKDASGHWHSCSCGATSDFSEHTSSGAATEDNAEVCTICGYEISPKLTHTHSYGTLKHDADNHWYECSCGDKSDVTAHSGGTATCTEKAVCSVCNQSYGNLKDHSYSSSWSSDASGHWHKCSCGATSAFAGHTSSGAATEDAAEVCTVCGYEISPALGHQHTHSTEWWKDEHGHWHGCECGDMPDFAEHTSSGAASYGIPETCTVCGYEIVPAKTTYSLTVNYEIYASDGAIIGSGIESKTIEFAPGTVVDLSDYWPEQMTSIGNNGTTYYFRGFSYSTDGGGNYYNAVTVSENTVMYAAWVRQNMVTVEFDTNDGAMSYKRARAGATYTISDMNSRHIPVRAGYDFVGWSLADDGTADSSDTEITADCTLYAVWQTYMPSYDDSWNPPAPGTTVEIGGDYDAVRISDGVIGKVIDNGNEVVVKFPDGTSGTLTDSALVAAKENLQDGESLQIAIKNVGSEVLPNSLTEKEPFEDDDGITHYSVFTTEGIFTYDELSEFGVFGGTDESISWGDMKLLYQYMTTEDLEKLYNRFSGGSEDLVPFVDWLNEMIEQDAVTPLNMQELMNMADLTDEQLEFLADMELNDPTIGQLRQAGLTVEQMRKLYGEVRILIGELNDNDKLSDCNELLGWLEDAIAQKELEASYEQMDEWIAGLSITDYGGKALDDAKLAAESMTTEELERFLENARETNMMASSLALGELISFLEDELEARESNDTPTYINTSGTNDGINPIFIGAVDVNIGAVKADGTTTPIAIKADRSDAFSEINSQKSEEPKHNMRLSRKKWRKFYVRSYDEKQRIVFTNFQYLGNEICDKRMLCV